MDVSTPGLTSEDSGIGSKSSGKPDEDKSSRKIAGYRKHRGKHNGVGSEVKFVTGEDLLVSL